ncbi:MAG: hypothetical protein K9N09_08240 [Candidatus Cloacimonetes bacterium]|nr:hypothetical protein [Candidatus Cloacimonadota bacterium]MCF7868674.1 hypothetical protein [Candidatus Cloacimonadota bacterium]
MRIFILTTGRAGSKTLIEACQYINNYTASHESLTKFFGEKRLDYPDDHIEADNRLSWFLGRLDEKFGDEAVYVHLIRDRKKVVKSSMKRWIGRGNIMKPFCEGIYMTPTFTITSDQKKQISADYYDCVNSNIALFLKDKTKKMELHLESIEKDFIRFWKLIGAEGDLDSAIKILEIKHNQSKKFNYFQNFFWNVKLWLKSLFNS